MSPRIDVVAPTGRLDTYNATGFAAMLGEVRDSGHADVIIDMAAVSYISSAAVRVLVTELKQRTATGGRVVLAAPREYVLNVLRISGLEAAFGVEPSVDAAIVALSGNQPPPTTTAWSAGERLEGAWGTMTMLPGSPDPGYVEIAGDINDVLQSVVSPAHIVSKQFSRKAYSLGLGGLGDRLEDYYTLLGEMMTIGGAMVWLPCDGHGLPDFLVPSNDAGQVLMRSGFNASIAGPFNEYATFQSADPAGTTLSSLYRVVFDLARRRRPDFKGAVGVAMRAEMPALLGAGVVRAPIVEHRPANGLPITHPSNFPAWFESDTEPRHRGVTGLIVGCGVDLTADLSAYSPEAFRRTFYINPANRGTADVVLHNHVVAFQPMPTDWDDATLEGEIRRVLDDGEFLDMRHLLDASTVNRAIIGLVYIQNFTSDTDLLPGHVSSL